jgi:hypothetical protein
MNYIKLLPIILSIILMMGCGDSTPPQSQSSQDTDAFVRTVLNKAGVDVPQHTQVNITRTPEELSTSSTGPSMKMAQKRNYFGWGSSAVTAASLYKGIDIGKTTSPEMNVNPETGETTIGSSTFGKTTAGAGGGTWLTALWQTAKDWGATIGIILLVIVIGGAVLYFMVPASQPIINWILRGIASIFPILGSLVESTVGTKKTAAVTSTVENTILGVDEAKNNLDEMIDNTDFTTSTFNKETFKTDARSLINTSLKSNHDQVDEDLIAKIKRANRL